VDALTRPTAPVASHGRALLQIWLSPAFPVGGFAYSHGIEKAVELGWIRDRATLETWLGGLLVSGSLHNDLILLAAAWRATLTGNDAELSDVSALAMALQPSSERRLEASQQGRSFLQHVAAAWPPPKQTPVDGGHRTATAKDPGYASASVGRKQSKSAFSDSPVAYPVAVGHVAARHGAALDDALSAFAVGIIGALTSAAIRLSVIGQTDGQRIMAALLGRLHDAARTATTSTLADLGGAAWRSDIASMQHETQSTRLFRS
jgi:urease accessory protein